MIRSELVLRIAEMNPHLYAKDVEATVDAILDRIEDGANEFGPQPVVAVELRLGLGFGFDLGKLEFAHGCLPFAARACPNAVRQDLPVAGRLPICGASIQEKTQMADTPETLTLTLDGGDVTIKLRPDLAPKHVERIVELANDGFYDGVVFHRVIPGFMAQGGDPTGTGMSGSDKPNLKAEFSAEPHVRGVCSMARTNQPDTANSQFFIVFDDARFLDKQYTVWGEVTNGMELIDALPKGEPPRQPGKIVKARAA